MCLRFPTETRWIEQRERRAPRENGIGKREAEAQRDGNGFQLLRHDLDRDPLPHRDGKDALLVAAGGEEAGGSDGLGLARVRRVSAGEHRAAAVRTHAQDRGSAEQIHQPHPGLAEQVPNQNTLKNMMKFTETGLNSCPHCVISDHQNTCAALT